MIKQDIGHIFKKYDSNEAVKLVSVLYPNWENMEKSFHVYTTRFNSITYSENINSKLVHMNRSNVSLYGTTLPLPSNIPENKYLIVFDMNNSTNKVMGFGFIKKKLSKNQKIRIYENPSFNRYIYSSNFYVSMNEIHEESWKDFIRDEFEKSLFYGKGNMKRGNNFTRYPVKRLNYKHMLFLVNLFAIKNPNKFNDIILKKVYQ